MYPQSPSAQEWRAAAASVAKANGTTIPSWFDGSDASAARLNSEAPDVLSAVRWFQQDYVLDHRDLFPVTLVEAAKAFIVKNPNPGAYAAPYALSKYGLGAMAGDFAADYTERVGKAVIGEGYSLDPAATGPLKSERKKSSGKEIGWGAVILLGLAGGLGWHYLGRAR